MPLMETKPADRSGLENVPVYLGHTGRPSRRAARLKQHILNTRRKLYIEPARIETDSYKRTEGDPAIVRRAKAFQDIVRGIQIRIYDDELIEETGRRFPGWDRYALCCGCLG